MSRRRIILFAMVAALLAAAVITLRRNCERPGAPILSLLLPAARLKNRSAPPRSEDFDQRVTLETLLEKENDSHRWSSARAATIEGFVVKVEEAGVEMANCLSAARRDIHIELAPRPDAPPRERVIVEVTPYWRKWAQRQGQDWSAQALRRDLLNHRCRFAGWLYFDGGHMDEAENTAPGQAHNWRATAWEIHPVTEIQVIR